MRVVSVNETVTKGWKAVGVLVRNLNLDRDLHD